jgi:hypothetical protein
MVAYTQGVGWPGKPASLPPCDPLLARINEHVDERATRQAERELRQTAQAAPRDEAGSSRAHEAEAGSSGAVRPQEVTVHIRAPAVREPRRGKATVQPQPVFKPGDRVMYASSVEGWVTVTVVAVDHGSLAAGEERAYTILWGDTERSTFASKLRAAEDYSTTFVSTNAREDIDYEMAVGHSDWEIAERLQEGESAAEGDYVMGDEWDGDGSEHLDHELRSGDLIFRREDTSTGCQLTGQYTAGRGVVPWSGQHEGGGGSEEDQPLGQDNRASKEARADPPQLVEFVRFDRTRQVRSTPWRLSGARVRLVDCTDPRLRGMEGVVQGWEQESGRIRVQVQSEVVHVWPGELVRIQEPEGQSGGERKRRTLEEPDTAAARAKDEVKRARSIRLQEPSATHASAVVDDGAHEHPRTPLISAAVDPRNLFAAVTSEGKRGNQRGVGRVLAGVASGMKGALRGIWKSAPQLYTLSRTSGGTPWGAKRKEDRRGEG